MTREELIAALEKATGADRKLDAALYKVVIGLEQYESIAPHEISGLCIRNYPGPPGPEYRALPRYTASIDAALTLVPEGLRWRVSSVPKHGYAGATVSDGSILATTTREWEGHHFTPAIALCIAALRARP